MNAAVFDTDVVSFLFKRHALALRYSEELTGRTPFLSFMSVAELERWAIESNWGAERRARLREFLRRFVVVPYDAKLCEMWAEVTVAARSRGRRIECADAWIAATALAVSAPLVTHNRGDYLGVPGLRLITHAA